MFKAFCKTCLFGVTGFFVVVQIVNAGGQTQTRTKDPVQSIPGGTDVTASASAIYREWRGRFPSNAGNIYCPIDTLKYIPVCARTQNHLVATYSNRCIALLDSAIVLTPDNEPCPQSDCHSLYQPVCARIVPSGTDVSLERPTIRPFINKCVAENYKDPDNADINVTIIRSYGEDIYMYPRPRHRPHHVDDDDFSRICPKEGSCPDKPEYVCAKDRNNKARIYTNKCVAVLEGAKFTHYMQPGRQPYFPKCE